MLTYQIIIFSSNTKSMICKSNSTNKYINKPTMKQFKNNLFKMWSVQLQKLTKVMFAKYLFYTAVMHLTLNNHNTNCSQQ